MLMMRLQRVGRKNDPSYRIVVTDKRTGVKSDKHVDRLGSYNPKLNHIQLDTEKAKEWLSKGVQPSGTMHNLLVSQKVIEGKKINVLPKKSPIIDEEAIKKAEEEAAAKAEAEKAATEAPVEEEKVEETAPAEAIEEAPEAPTEDAKPEEIKEEEVTETPAEEPVKEEEKKEEVSSDTNSDPKEEKTTA